MTSRALAIALLFAGCKSPSYVSGHLACAATAPRCPDGFHCAADNRCWKNGQDPDLTGIDLATADDLAMPDDLAGADLAGIDLAISDFASAEGGAADLAAVDAGCGWPLTPSNIDPCAVPLHQDAWTVVPGTYNTDTGAGAGGPAGTLMAQSQAAGPMVRVVHVNSFSLSTGTLAVIGAYPLVILADIVAIDGTVNVTAGQNAFGCPSVNGTGFTNCGAGGAGGSFGALGGKGGGCAAGAATNANSGGNGNTTLVPLRGGCAGGTGGAAGGATQGSAGPSGGALQISARVSLTVSGTLASPGFFGGGGNGSVGTCAGSTNCSAGAGGGGSGGAIFLESPVVTVMGKLCANGGGGGEGGGVGVVGVAPGGGLGTCIDAPSAAGSGGTNGGDGSGGGHASHPAGFDGNGTIDQNGGGGGGGSVGRIRVRAGNGNWKGGGAVVTPNAFEG